MAIKPHDKTHGWISSVSVPWETQFDIEVLQNEPGILDPFDKQIFQFGSNQPESKYFVSAFLTEN